MVEQVWDHAPVRPKRTLGGYLKARSNRKEYWLAMLAMTGVGFVFGLFGGSVGTALAAPSLIFMVRRLHDIGKSGWWALAITFGPLVPMVALLPFAPMTVLLPLVMLLSLIWTIWLGAIPGEPHENRWGPPPGRRALDEVFS
jgi:uncharacterized membrane protein YhaH (DUF805 family)